MPIGWLPVRPVRRSLSLATRPSHRVYQGAPLGADVVRLHICLRKPKFRHMGVALKSAAMAAAFGIIAGAVLPVSAGDILDAPSDFDRPAQIDEPTDAELRDLLVQQSIARYTGACACPYHRKWNETLFMFPNAFRQYPTVRCGDDSEYIRPGGPTVFCYPADVPAELVEEYREHLRATFLTEPTPRF